MSAFKIEDILLYMNASNRRIESTIFDHYQYEIFNYMQWMWYCRVRVYLIPFAAIVFSLVAMFVVLAQIAIFIPVLSFFNPFAHMLAIKSFVGLDLMLLILLGYMALEIRL